MDSTQVALWLSCKVRRFLRSGSWGVSLRRREKWSVAPLEVPTLRSLQASLVGLEVRMPVVDLLGAWTLLRPSQPHLGLLSQRWS